MDGAVATSADGQYTLNSPVVGSLSGRLSAEFLTVGSDSVIYRMTGTPAAPTRPFDVEVTKIVGFETVATDTLSAVLVEAAASRW